MIARAVELVELPDGGCHLVVEVEGVSVIVSFTADEAIDLGGRFLDGSGNIPPLISEVAS